MAKGGKLVLAMAVLLFCSSLFNAFSPISIGQALAAGQEIRVGLLFGPSAATQVTMERDGDGVLVAVTGADEVQLVALPGAGNQSFTATPGATYVVEEGFSTYAEAAVRAQEAGEAIVAWAGQWLVWRKHSGCHDPAHAVPAHIIVAAETVEFALAAPAKLRFYPQGELTRVDNKNRRYRGMMELSLVDNGLQLVNQLPLEDYLLGVVPYEMSPSWELEALKAQAVAARTYALRNWYKYSQYGFNVDDTTNSQVYYGYTPGYETARVVEAVESTRGQVIFYRGRLIDSLYHSTCGGHTDDARNLWGSRIDYLLGRECGYCQASPRHSWEYATVIQGVDNFGRAGFADLLRQRGLIGPDFVIDEIELVWQVTESGFARRVDKVVLTDPAGNKLVLSGTSVYSALISASGSTPPTSARMWSQFFTVNTDASVYFSDGTLVHGGLSRVHVQTSGGVKQPQGDTIYVMTAQGLRQLPVRPTTINFPGWGWGHGVGMCQWGAQGMAKQGYDYIQILQYYYSGVDIP